MQCRPGHTWVVPPLRNYSPVPQGTSVCVCAMVMCSVMQNNSMWSNTYQTAIHMGGTGNYSHVTQSNSVCVCVPWLCAVRYTSQGNAMQCNARQFNVLL